jgi:hypothetical protein
MVTTYYVYMVAGLIIGKLFSFSLPLLPLLPLLLL